MLDAMVGKEKNSLKSSSKLIPCVKAGKPAKFKTRSMSSLKQTQSKITTFQKSVIPSNPSDDTSPDLESAMDTEGTEWASIEDDSEFHGTTQVIAQTVASASTSGSAPTWVSIALVDTSQLSHSQNGDHDHVHMNDSATSPSFGGKAV